MKEHHCGGFMAPDGHSLKSFYINAKVWQAKLKEWDLIVPSSLTFGQVVREYFPDASDENIDSILWEKTGYPCFWETDDTEACLRKQLQELKEEVIRNA